MTPAYVATHKGGHPPGTPEAARKITAAQVKRERRRRRNLRIEFARKTRDAFRGFALAARRCTHAFAQAESPFATLAGRLREIGTYARRPAPIVFGLTPDGPEHIRLGGGPITIEEIV